MLIGLKEVIRDFLDPIKNLIIKNKDKSSSEWIYFNGTLLSK